MGMFRGREASCCGAAGPSFGRWEDSPEALSMQQLYAPTRAAPSAFNTSNNFSSRFFPYSSTSSCNSHPPPPQLQQQPQPTFPVFGPPHLYQVSHIPSQWLPHPSLHPHAILQFLPLPNGASFGSCVFPGSQRSEVEACIIKTRQIHLPLSPFSSKLSAVTRYSPMKWTPCILWPFQGQVYAASRLHCCTVRSAMQEECSRRYFRPLPLVSGCSSVCVVLCTISTFKTFSHIPS